MTLASERSASVTPFAADAVGAATAEAADWIADIEGGGTCFAPIYDEQGGLLGLVRVVGVAGRTIEVAVERRNAGTLLQYLYGAGRRKVSLETEGAIVQGRLSTSWTGHRRWFVQVA